jgi:hypothetical protein
MRLTKTLFWLSDIAAWMLLSVSAAGAVFMPIFARADTQPVSWTGAAAVSAICLLVAAGAYGVTRRRPLFLVLVALPAVASSASGDLSFALPYLVTILAVFGSPFVLAFFESRTRTSREEA